MTGIDTESEEHQRPDDEQEEEVAQEGSHES
jgi:hypothetical protein